MDPWWRRPSPEQREDGDDADGPRPKDDRGPAALSRAAAEEELEASSEGAAEEAAEEDEQPRGRRDDREGPPSRRPKSRRSRRSRGKKRRDTAPRKEREARPARRSGPAASVATAVFCDLERFARALRGAGVGPREAPQLFAQLFPKRRGDIRRAYTSGNRHARLQHELGDFGFARVEADGGGHSLRLRLALDALDLAHTEEPPQRFILLADDDALLPLTERLRERGCQVLCLDAPGELAESGDGLFILDPDQAADFAEEEPGEDEELERHEVTEDQVFERLLEAVAELHQGPPQLIWGTMVLQRMQEESPHFNERSCGYESFESLLEEAARQGLVRLRRDPRSDTYLLTAYRSPENRDA